MRTRGCLVDGGIARVEVVVLTLVLLLTGASVVLMLSRRSAQMDRSERIAASRAALVDAAAAVERYAKARDGFYSGLTGRGQEFLEEFGFDPHRGITVSVVSSASDSYCLRAANGNLGPDEWRTATYSSTDQTVSPRDDCGSS